jgi:hypothetical protein
MYGKSFESKYEGSMVGAGVYVFAVWDYCITKNRSGIVELNPRLLAFVLDGDTDGLKRSEEHIEAAIEYLMRPDLESRSRESEGRRLVKEGTFQYRMVNWSAYDGLKSIAEQREYNRRKQAEYRAKKRGNGSAITREELEAHAGVQAAVRKLDEAQGVAAAGPKPGVVWVKSVAQAAQPAQPAQPVAVPLPVASAPDPGVRAVTISLEENESPSGP